MGSKQSLLSTFFLKSWEQKLEQETDREDKPRYMCVKSYDGFGNCTYGYVPNEAMRKLEKERVAEILSGEKMREMSNSRTDRNLSTESTLTEKKVTSSEDTSVSSMPLLDSSLLSKPYDTSKNVTILTEAKQSVNNLLQMTDDADLRKELYKLVLLLNSMNFL
jgi:hypothetical protein